jgi:hypothetical protein
LCSQLFGGILFLAVEVLDRESQELDMNLRTQYLAAILLLLGNTAAFAGGSQSEGSQMGRMHGGHGGQMMTAMQECLKSGKTMTDCRQQMMENHRSGMMGHDACPMMSGKKPEQSAQGPNT